MESSIVKLGPHTDEATKKMLQNVVTRKNKYEKVKQQHLIILWLSIFYGFSLSYFSYRTIVGPNDSSFYNIFFSFFTNTLYVFLFSIAIFLFVSAKILFDKKEKKEKEYHDLRCEIIDRSKDLWKEEAWKQRHQIFELMKEEYDINLYHQSK
ncbi:DUF2663 family protein [Bacillus spongiae]|uniref:DUF2663 family protein n=1 Tax=Bacillus spongiae TaxID=2683610 RepID=A0ABU8HD77_9BACI